MSSLEAFRKIVRQLQFDDNQEPNHKQTISEIYDIYSGNTNSDLKQSGSKIDSKNSKKIK